MKIKINKNKLLHNCKQKLIPFRNVQHYLGCLGDPRQLHSVDELAGAVGARGGVHAFEVTHRHMAALFHSVSRHFQTALRGSDERIGGLNNRCFGGNGCSVIDSFLLKCSSRRSRALSSGDCLHPRRRSTACLRHCGSVVRRTTGSSRWAFPSLDLLDQTAPTPAVAHSGGGSRYIQVIETRSISIASIYQGNIPSFSSRAFSRLAGGADRGELVPVDGRGFGTGQEALLYGQPRRRFLHTTKHQVGCIRITQE